MGRGPARPSRLVLLTALLITACGEPEEILPGERFGLRETEAAAASMAAREAGEVTAPPPQPGRPPRRIPQRPYEVTGEPTAISLPAARANPEWTHAGGNAAHRVPHPALGRPLTRIWEVPIGAGNGRRLRINAAPVVAGGRIFTMDAESVVQATSPGGQPLWRRNLTPATERAGDAAAGGLASDGGSVYATTGYGTLHRLDATTGAVIWTQVLGAAPTAGPTVAGDIVYLTSRNSQAWAVDRDTGRVIWQIDSAEEGPVLTTGASPAVSGRAVLLPFGSGELIAALRESGLQLWSASLTGERVGRAYSRIGDISADPVVVGETAYVGNAIGRLAALDITTGDRRWTAQDGALGPVKVEGGSIFFVSDASELVRLNAATGEVIWKATLPIFVTDRVRRRKEIFAHYGPLLAGGRLLVASTDGLVREIDPTNGQIIGSRALGAGAAAPPIVAGGVLYVLTEQGRLQAYR